MPRLIPNKAREACLPFVEPTKTRHGNYVYYFRRERHGARVRLPDDLKSPAFMEAYQACIAGLPVPGVAKTPHKSFGWLVKLYLASSSFRSDFADSTQATRRRQLERIAAESGHVSLTMFTQAAIQASINKRRETPHEANALLSTLKKMFAWAAAEYATDASGEMKPLIQGNPAKFVEPISTARRGRHGDGEEAGHPTFSDEDLATFEAAYAHGTRERLVYELFLNTGLRLGDAARVGRQHVKGAEIRLKTEKTGTDVALLITPRLAHALEAGPKGEATELAFLTTARGKAWEKSYLGYWFAEACQKAGLDRSAHGLRKAAARRYIEAGADPAMLKAIFGWETMAMVDKYTKKFNRRKVSVGAMGSIVLDAEFCPHPESGAGKTAATA